MPAGRVLEAVDVWEDDGFGFAAGCPRPAPDQFGLDGLEERLDNGVITALALVALRRPQAVVAQNFLVVVRTILAATVAMEDATRRWGPEREGHFQRADREIPFHAIADGPAVYARGVQVQDHRQLERTLAGPDIADVPRPSLMGLSCYSSLGMADQLERPRAIPPRN